MLDYTHIAIMMTALLCRMIPVPEDTWIECQVKIENIDSTLNYLQGVT